MDGYGISHEQRNWMIALVLPIQIMTTLLLWIRLLSRFHRSGGQPGFDDALVFVGWVLGTGLSATVLLATYQYGYNRHTWDVPFHLWPKAALLAFIIEILFLFSTCSTKISILLFYRRLVSDTCSRNFKLALWCAIAFIVMYAITFLILMLTNCNPIKATWMQYDRAWTETHPYKCVKNDMIVAGSEAAGGLSVVTDFYSVMLPAVLLRRIQINGRQRLGLIFIFGLGYLVIAAGCVRTVYFGRAQGLRPDKFWLAFNVFASSVAECNISIICACAPSLRALFSRYFRGLTTTTSNISEGDLKSQVKSTRSSMSSYPSSNKFIRVIGNNQSLNASVTSTEGQLSEVDFLDTLEVPGAGKTRLSFRDAHEYGIESLGRITEAYEEPPYWQEHCATVPIFLDTNIVGPVIDHRGNIHCRDLPPISVNLVPQEAESPHSSLSSETLAGDEKSETSSISSIKPSESLSNEYSDPHLTPTFPKCQYFLVPPCYIQRRPSKLATNSKALRPPTPGILRTSIGSSRSPLSDMPWMASMTKAMPDGNTGSSSRRKLKRRLNRKFSSREKWKKKKQQTVRVDGLYSAYESRGL